MTDPIETPPEPPDSPLPASADLPESAAASPLGDDRLAGVFVRPLRAMTVVLAEADSLAQTIRVGASGLLLPSVLLFVTMLFAIPYGLVLDPSRFWRVALLLLGSLTICLPSLQVFSSYVGCRIDTVQNLALGLVITAVAALFCFGFFPVLWFLDATMDPESDIPSSDISPGLLCFALGAGVVHLVRCLRSMRESSTAYPYVVGCWVVLLTYITWRMARLLGLWS